MVQEQNNWAAGNFAYSRAQPWLYRDKYPSSLDIALFTKSIRIRLLSKVGAQQGQIHGDLKGDVCSYERAIKSWSYTFLLKSSNQLSLLTPKGSMLLEVTITTFLITQSEHILDILSLSLVQLETSSGKPGDNRPGWYAGKGVSAPLEPNLGAHKTKPFGSRLLVKCQVLQPLHVTQSVPILSW